MNTLGLIEYVCTKHVVYRVILWNLIARYHYKTGEICMYLQLVNTYIPLYPRGKSRNILDIPQRHLVSLKGHSYEEHCSSDR
jgi:hypothetical protein